MSWIAEKLKNLSDVGNKKKLDGMKIGLWVCASFFFIALIVLVIVFFALTPILITKIALPLSSILCALLMVPTMLCFQNIISIIKKRNFSDALAQYKKIDMANEAIQKKENEISRLNTELQNYKKIIDDMRLQLANQMATPLELQNISVEDRHILCTVPIVMEKFYNIALVHTDGDTSENSYMESTGEDLVNTLNIFNPMEDIQHRNIIVMEHRVFPQVSISYKKIFIKKEIDGTLLVYGVIPEIVSKSTEQAEEHIVKLNEMIKTYKRLGKKRAKIIYDDAAFEKIKMHNKEKFIDDFNEKLANGVMLQGLENIFTAMAQEHIRRYILQFYKAKQIKFIDSYYKESVDASIDGGENAKPFIEFLHSESKQLTISD